MVLAVSYVTVLPTRLVYVRFKMNFDAVDGDSKENHKQRAACFTSLANQAVDNPLQRLWAVDAADNWTQLIAKEAAVIFRVLDPESYASWPQIEFFQDQLPHFVQLVCQAQLLSTEDSIGAEAPIPPIPPAQQEKREVPLGGRHRCSMDRLHCIEPSYLDLGP